MIFVTVGKGLHSFDRLVKAADDLAAEMGEKVFIQYGCSSYKPVHAEGRDYVTFPEAQELTRTSSIMIAHAGIGTIIGALRSGIPIVIVPRYKKNGEHFNDHQLEIAEAVKGRPGVEVVYEGEALLPAVQRLLNMKQPLVPQVSGAGLINAIDEFLSGLNG